MLYLHYDSFTTALLPYFIGLVYLSIACWVSGETSPEAIFTPAPNSSQILPEQVFQLLEPEPIVIPTQGKPKVARAMT